MRTLLRLAASPAHPVAGWRAEILTTAVLAGGLVGMLLP